MRRRPPFLLYLTFLAAVLLGASGCVKATVTTAPNPAFPLRTYDRVVVWVNFADLGLRKEMEGRFVKRATALGLSMRVAPAHLLFYPGKQYTAQEMAELLKASGSQAVLYVVSTAVGSSDTWIPPVVSSAGGSTVVTGGYPLSSPYGNYSVHLIDVDRSEVAWYATAALTGDVFTDHDDILKRLVDEVLRHLTRDGFAAVGTPQRTRPQASEHEPQAAAPAPELNEPQDTSLRAVTPPEPPEALVALPDSHTTDASEPSSVQRPGASRPVSLGAGLALPVYPDLFMNGWKPGLTLAIDFESPVNRRLSLRGSGLYQRFEPKTSSEGSGPVSVALLAGEVKAVLWDRERFQPYVVGGVGAGRVAGKINLRDSWEIGPALSFAGGATWRAGSVGLFVEGGYVIVFTKRDVWSANLPTHFLPLRAGFRF
ncbi:MAG: hypothetical protein HY704_08265 [Gemmatimonadetes bacterium]|nr:hypothetical protein [Gemmatimonadota bacterium]